MMENSPLVSICCITYNQAAYIKKAVDSFLNQKTSFSFEILVHDDASTDGTLEILEEYENLYEDFHLFSEVENRYKDGINYINEILIPCARGRYIAICEGDDYWISEHKLQNSIDYLEGHPECSLFVNAAILQDSNDNHIGEMGLGNIERNLSTRELVNNWHIPTASFVFKRDDAVEYAATWTFKTPVGDFPRAFFLSTLGYVHYCPEKLCVYRYGSEGSWTSRNRTSLSAAIDSAKSWLTMLENIDSITRKKYHNAVLDSAANKVLRLYGRIGKNALDGQLSREAWDAFSKKKKLAAYLLRFLGKFGWDVQRVNWSGFRQWTLVRVDE